MLYNACVTRQPVKVMIRDCSGATEETFENMVVLVHLISLLWKKKLLVWVLNIVAISVWPTTKLTSEYAFINIKAFYSSATI